MTINPTTTARSPGVVLDEELKLSKHVASVCRSRYYQLRQLRHIRRYLDLDSATTLDNSFITSRIGYCNSLLAAAPRYQTDELQRVQNSAARLLLKLPKCDRRLRVLVQHRLHWLRVPERITFNCALSCIGLCTELRLHTWQNSVFRRVATCTVVIFVRPIVDCRRCQGDLSRPTGQGRFGLPVQWHGTLSPNTSGIPTSNSDISRRN